jgi:hypothetical protein
MSSRLESSNKSEWKDFGLESTGERVNGDCAATAISG